MLLFLEMHRRVFGGAFGRLPECLSQDAFDMRGNCIDAPDAMPAGSVVFSKFGPDPEDWVDVPSMVEREPKV
jgi:hypothetical protein